MIVNTNKPNDTTQQESGSRQKRQSRTRWTSEEIEAVVNRMVNRRENEPIPSALYLLQAAQEVLPAARRREIKTLLVVPDLVERFNQAWKERQNGAHAMQPFVVEVPAPPQPIDLRTILAEAPVEDLAACLFGRIASRLDSLTHSKIISPSAISSTINGSAAVLRQQCEKPRLMRIAIVGLMHDQFKQVEQRLKGKADLRFVDKDQSRTSFPTVDHIIVQKHTGHKWYEAAQNRCPNKHVTFVDGGITQTAQKVCDILSRQ